MITRTNASALIPTAYSKEIIKEVAAQSVLMRKARRLPDVARATTEMPVVTVLPNAYWVNGDTGQKKTTKQEWGNVILRISEIAVIVPIPEAVLDDADYDIWAEVKPEVVAAFGAKVDLAALYDVDRPSIQPEGILTQAAAKGHTVDLSSVIGGGGDIFDATLGEGGVFSKVEEDGYSVNGAAARLTMKAKLRGLRDSQGNLIFNSSVQGTPSYSLDGVPLDFMDNHEETDADMFVGDWRKLMWAVRQDMTYKILDQAVIQDDAGNIQYNLAQQDMVALRCVMRLGWVLPNPINRVNTDEATRFPFAVLVP